MLDLRRVFIFSIPIAVLLIIPAMPAFSQPPGGEMDQMQMSQSTQVGQQQGSQSATQQKNTQTSGSQQGAQSGSQQQGGPGGQQGFGQMGGQQAGQMQTMITQALKQKLGCTDDEWTVLGPKVLKVYTLLSSQSTGLQMRQLMGNSRQGNSQGRSGSNQSTSSDDKTIEELQTLLLSEDTTSTQLKSKIAEVRKAKEKTRQELAKAQKDLRELLSLKQEAILISLGMLE